MNSLRLKIEVRLELQSPRKAAVSSSELNSTSLKYDYNFSNSSKAATVCRVGRS